MSASLLRVCVLVLATLNPGGQACAFQSPRSEFYRLAGESDTAGGEVPLEAQQYLSRQPRSVQLDIAQSLVKESRLSFIGYGASILTSLGHSGDAVGPITTLILKGQDVSGLFWSWLHGSDPCLFNRMYVRLGHNLLGRLSTLTAEERHYAEAFLSQSLTGPPTPAFTRARAEANLQRVDDELRERRCP